MKPRELLVKINQIAKNNSLSKPFIVGGIPRDQVRGQLQEANDIDLTSERGDTIDLAFACSKVLPFKFFQLFDDRHISMIIDSIQLDFSNHFIIPTIQQELNKLHIKSPTPLIKELFSRDFTINTLLQDIETGEIYDFTKQGVKDIKAGVIRCPIDPNITIKHDPKRILRALQFALRFDYQLDDSLIKAIKKHKQLLKTINNEYVKDKANQLIKLNPDRAIEMMIEFGLLSVIPMTKTISDKLIESKMLYYSFYNT